MSDSLWPYRLQHTRLPCPSPFPGVCSNSCSSSRWCHPTISSSVVPFSSCPRSFPASGSSSTSQPFESGGHSIGVSASASVLPMNIQGRFPLGLTDLISWQSKGPSRVFCNTIIWKHQFFDAQPSLWSNTLICTRLLKRKKTHTQKCSFDCTDFVGKVMSLLFNTLSRFVIASLQRIKHLLISWLQSPSAVILESKKIKSVTVSIVSQCICYGVLGSTAMIFIFWM